MAETNTEEETSEKIVEEEEDHHPKEEEEENHDEQREKSSQPLLPPHPNTSSSSSTAKAFSFWARLILFVSLLTLLLRSLRSRHYSDDAAGRSWFLGLPGDLRAHYSRGKLVKAQAFPGLPPVEVFAVERGPKKAETNVLLLHGLGCSSYSFRRVLTSLGAHGFRAVAIDLPGSGFSDKLVEEDGGGILGRVWNVYRDISEKGIFWGFDNLVQTGQIPYEESRARVYYKGKGEEEENLRYGAEGLSRIVGEVIDSLALAPVHLVLHDSALGIGANWVSANPRSVSSVTLVDSTSESAAFPSWIVGTAVLGQFVLRSRLAFGGLLRLCCSRSVDDSSAEAYWHLLNGKNGRRAVVAAGKSLNFSFDLGEWASSEVVKDVPLQVLWSNTWSDVWIDEGRRIAGAVPRAKFVTHFGGRWPQEGAADEIAGKISEFVSSLPKSVRQGKEEPLPEHIQKLFDEASKTPHDHHHHHHHHHGHGHEHSAGYMDAYGLGHGWGS